MGDFSVVDVVFTPYVERMNASLFYYKGFQLRDPKARPYLCAWFDAMERRPTYLGTQSDYHTHVHDLPPQMGGCFESGDAKQMGAATLLTMGHGWGCATQVLRSLRLAWLRQCHRYYATRTTCCVQIPTQEA